MWFFWSEPVWLGLDGLGWLTYISGGLKWNAGPRVWPEPLSIYCLSSSVRQDQACSRGETEFPPARASLVSNLLVSHLSNKVIQPSPDPTDREVDSAACGKRARITLRRHARRRQEQMGGCHCNNLLHRIIRTQFQCA